MMKYVSFIAMALILGSCTSYRWETRSEAEPTVFKDGVGLYEQTLGDVVLRVGISEYDEDSHTFLVEWVNNGTQPLVADPVSFMENVVPGFRSGSSKTPESHAALDPEVLIKDLREQIRREKESYEFEKGMNAVSGVVSIVSIASGKKSGWRDLGETSREMEDDEREHNQKMALLEGRLDRYTKVLARKTSVAPGQSYSGMVIIPTQTQWKKFVLRAPLGEPPFTFDFQWVKVNSKGKIIGEES